MKQKKAQKNNDFLRNDTYNSIKDQLQMENEALLQQRRQIQTKVNRKQTKGKRKQAPNQYRPSQNSHSIIEQSGLEYQGDITNNPQFGDQANNTTDRVRRKIYEVIRLCETDQNISNGQFRQIMQAQKQILNYLDGSKSQNNSARKLSRNKMQKIGDSPKKSIREQINNNGFRHLITDDAMEMIQEIQRKALNEIQSLRMDKITLMKKLNQETKDHNEEKRKRIMLQKKVKELQQLLSQRSRVVSYPPNNNYSHSNVQGQGQKNGHGQKYNIDNQQIEEQSSQEQNEQSEEEDNDYQEYEEEEESNVPVYTPHQRIPVASQKQLPPPTITPKAHRKQDQYRNKPQRQPTRFREAQSNNYLAQNQPGQFGSENQLSQQIHRLQYQNKNIRQNISPDGNNFFNPLKNKLRSQLTELQSQIRSYQSVLQSQGRGNNRSRDQELESLLQQGNNLTSEGQKLIRVKSKPQFEQGNNNSREELNFLRDKINYLQRENGALQSNSKGQKKGSINSPPSSSTNIHSMQYKSQTPKARTNNYESILEEMRKVTGI